MQNAEEDNARIFGMGPEVTRDTVLPQTRDTIANGMNMRDSIAAGMNDMASPDQSPPNDEFAQMEDGLNMPSYYNPETKDNYDDLIQSSFIQQERSNSFNSKEGQMHDIYAGTTNADSNYFKNVSALNQTQIERIQDLIE
jgi:hypothetical protein